MEDIRFYNYEFELLHIESNFISSNWQVRYNEVGQFEAHFPLDSEMVRTASENPFLVAVQGKNTAIITGKKAGEDFAIFGRTCNWLLTKRIVPAFTEKTGTVAELACGLAQEAFADTENFACEVCGEFENSFSFKKEEYLPLFDVISECLNLDGAGHELVFDVEKKQWVLQIRCGRELELLISEDNRNASYGEICEDILERYDVGWYRQKQETEEGQTFVWTSVERSQAQGIYRSECLLSAQTQEEAERELAEKKKNFSLTIESLGVRWRTDYELGDVVRVQVKKGSLVCTGSKRITGVHLWYEEGEIGEQPIMQEKEEEDGI